MTGYLLDTSALWYIFRNPDEAERWREPARVGALYLCEPTRTELLYSATSSAHRDEMAEALDELCRPAPVPKSAWRWVDSAQYKLTQRGLHRSAGVVDLVVCATAVHHDLTVLHIDNDFATVSSVLGELKQRNITNPDQRDR
ncbi:PIN domain-containing protein [Nocardia sp. NPDC059240]|uniref:PIN domain-containing protein n=1 Tax=Nocardia sp. NPDC059240 TaxID=3346786 RepID=UPI003693F802